MANFNFSLADMLVDSFVDKVVEEIHANTGKLQTSNHKNKKPNPTNFTMFNLSEILMKVPGFNSAADVLAKYEGLATSGLGSIYDKVKGYPGLAAILPDGLEKILDDFAVEPAGGTDTGGTATGSGDGRNRTGDLAWGGYSNGEIPDSAMIWVKDAAGTRFRFEKSAGEDFEKLVAASKEAGLPVTLTGAYRDYATQVRLKAEKPTLAATPGRSNHGWGRAIDVANNRGFVQKNGHKWNWIWPSWARPGGSRPEDWHMEHRPAGNAAPTGSRQAGQGGTT